MSDRALVNFRRDFVRAFIIKFTEDKGYPPSVREIATAAEVSASTIQSDLAILQGLGKITRDATKPRTVVVAR